MRQILIQIKVGVLRMLNVTVVLLLEQENLGFCRKGNVNLLHLLRLWRRKDCALLDYVKGKYEMLPSWYQLMQGVMKLILMEEGFATSISR